MPQYLVTFISESALDLEGWDQEFRYSDGVVASIRPDITRDNISNVPIGFRVSANVRVIADNIEDAVVKAGTAADLTFGVLATVHGSAIATPRFERAFDTSEGIVDRELIQRLELPRKIQVRRKYRHPDFSLVYEHLNRASPDVQQLILVGFHWYRKALMEQFPADQFANLWTALEALNPVLKGKHDLPQEQTVRSCPECHSPVISSPTLAGVEYALTRLIGENKNLWRKANGVRQSLFHRGMLGAVTECLPALRKAVFAALLDCLDIPANERPKLFRQPVGVTTEAFVVAKTKILGFPDNRLGAPLPQFRLAVDDASTFHGDDGTRNEKFSLTISLVGAEGYEHSSITLDWRYACDSEDEKASIQVTHRPVPPGPTILTAPPDSASPAV
jgi:hypothetical protein